MPLDILPFTASDIPRGLEIHDRALNPSLSPVVNILFNPPATPQALERQIERFTSGPDRLLFKAVDNGIMIGFISARRVHKVADSSSFLHNGTPSWDESCGISKATWDKCFEMRTEARKESFDYSVDHLHVHALATDPEYQRRGAGAALLEKLKTIVDKEGLPIYLTSSESGRKLYERSGFKVAKELVIDFEEMGETKRGRETFAYMIRQSEGII